MAIGSDDDRTFEAEKKEGDWTSNLSNQSRHFFGFAEKKEHASVFYPGPCTRVRHSPVRSGEWTLLSAWLKQGRGWLML